MRFRWFYCIHGRYAIRRTVDTGFGYEHCNVLHIYTDKHDRKFAYTLMEIGQYIDVLEALPQRVSEQMADAVIVPAAGVMVAAIVNRNANEGLNTDGTKRKPYSTKPTYAGASKFVRKSGFVGEGKNGGKPRKTKYLAEGYKQLREIQGLRTDIKNYEYSGDTLLAFGLEARQNEVVIGFRTDRTSKIRRGLEQREGRAFPPSSNELREYEESVRQELTNVTIKAFNDTL